MLTKQPPLVQPSPFTPATSKAQALVESVLSQAVAPPSPPPSSALVTVGATQALKLHHSIFEVVDPVHDVLGQGSYGTVYAGVQRSQTADLPVAVKAHDDAFLLDREVQLYRYLWRHKKRGVVPQLRIPRLLWEGTTDDGKQRVVVLDRLGTSLDQLFDAQGKCWGHATVCWVACEALRLLEGLHTLGVVHRDLKPDNFAIGYDADERHRLYTFDFGLSSQYLDKEGQHRPMRTGLTLIGTLRYASLANHDGHQQSRRDDLESLGYVLWCLAAGTLPWKHAVRDVEDRSERNRLIAEAKRALDLNAVPAPFGELIRYARGLAYEAAPDYATWVARFEALAGTAASVPDWLLPHPPVTAGRVARSRKQRPAKKC